MFDFNVDKYLTQGNNLEIYRDGEAFFANLIRRIREAKREILIETFILEEGRVATLLKKALLQAAKRDLWICITVDSYGSHFLPQDYIKELTDAGIVFQIYQPQPKWFRGRPRMFRRLHRKLCVIDAKYAFVGGINLCDEHLVRDNPDGMRDFAAQVRGPVVAAIRRLCRGMVQQAEHAGCDDQSQDSNPQASDGVDLAFVYRDNGYHRSEIEKAYLHALKKAKQRILIANAYFFPGYRMLAALRHAVSRGITVQVVLQGNPDIPAALLAARSLYEKLANYGVEIYEYTERPLHGKIAVIDDNWCTVGSSNLDPWSLGLNLEANLIAFDNKACEQLESHIAQLIENSRVIEKKSVKRRDMFQALKYTVIYHSMRWWPNLVNWIPDEPTKIRQLRRGGENPRISEKVISTEGGKS